MEADDRLAEAVQAVVLRKILSFDPEVDIKTSRVLVLASDAHTKEAELLEASLREAGFQAERVAQTAVIGALSSKTILYLFPRTGSPELKAACLRLRVITVAGETEPVSKGDVVIGLVRNAENKSHIVINHKLLKEVNHYLPAAVLALATIY